MSELVIGLDIGSAFTKIAIRHEVPAPCEVLSLKADAAFQAGFLIPSAVAFVGDRRTHKPLFGADAFGINEGPTVRRFVNWKRDLFSDAPLPPPRPVGWDALFASEEMRGLVQEYGIPPGELDSLALLTASARAFSGAPTLQQVRQSIDLSPQTRAHAVAVRFLTWLRQQTLASIREHHPNLPDIEAILVRVTVPAFAAGGHLDPQGTKKHGEPWGDGHLGDLPPLHVGVDGNATAPVLGPRLKLADVKNRSLMVHAGGDNHADHPAPLGGGGARMACGVIAG